MSQHIRLSVRLGLITIGFGIGTYLVLMDDAMNSDAQNQPVKAVPSSMQVYPLRLTPGQDLKKELIAFATREGLRAPTILTCVGSLTQVTLRYANQAHGITRKGHFEIVSLVGLADQSGGHLHLSVADKDGAMFGGHLMDGCIIYTTAEVVIGELNNAEFQRVYDKSTGYKELTITPNTKNDKPK